MAQANLFTGAQPVNQTATSPKRNEPQEVKIDDLEMYTSLSVLMDEIEGRKATYEARVKNQIVEHQAALGAKLEKQPANFKGKDGDAEGSCQLRAKTSRQALDELQKEVLAEAKIPTKEISEVVIPDLPLAYLFNPEHQAWVEQNASKISKALVKLGAPEDLIQKIEGKKKTIVTEDSLAAVFKKSETVQKLLIPLVCQIAVRPKISDQSKLPQAYDRALVELGLKEKGEE